MGVKYNDLDQCKRLHRWWRCYAAESRLLGSPTTLALNCVVVRGRARVLTTTGGNNLNTLSVELKTNGLPAVPSPPLTESVDFGQPARLLCRPTPRHEFAKCFGEEPGLAGQTRQSVRGIPELLLVALLESSSARVVRVRVTASERDLLRIYRGQHHEPTQHGHCNARADRTKPSRVTNCAFQTR